MKIVDISDECPLCGEAKIPNDMGKKQFPGNRDWFDHYWYDCDEGGFSASMEERVR